MNNNGLDAVVGIIRLVSFAMMIGPVCYFIYYYGKTKQMVIGVHHVRQYWYAVYASFVILLLFTETVAGDLP